MRCLKVVATTAVVALGTAAPSLAADGEAPPLSVPALLEPPAPADDPVAVAASPVPSLEEVVLEQAEEIVDAALAEVPPSAAETEEEDEPADSGNPQVAVVSSAPEGDITPVAQSLPVEQAKPSESTPADHEATDRVAPETDGAAEPEPTGDSAGVAASDESGIPLAGAGELTSEPEAAPLDADADASYSDANSPGYHVDNSQYQSSSDPSVSPWHWSWEFATDCAGNTTSTSREKGSPSSLDWAWEWAWEWSCTEARPPPSVSAADVTTSTNSSAGDMHVSVRVLSPGQDGSVVQSGSPAGAASTETTDTQTTTGPWSWTWTFTFCGETTSLTTDVQSGTPLSWTWSWAWNWTCDAPADEPAEVVVEAPPAPAVVVDRSSAPDVVAEQPVAMSTVGLSPVDSVIPAMSPVIPRVEIPALVAPGPFHAPPVPLAVGGVGVELEIQLGPEIPLLEPTEFEGATSTLVHVDVSVTSATAEQPLLPAPGAPDATGAPAATPMREPGREAVTSSPPRPNAPVALARPPGSSANASNTNAPAERHTARPAPPRRDRDKPLSLFDEPRSSQASGGLGTSGGLVPSAPLVAVAALIAFFVLVAPGLGRRIRVARELSPRDAYRSSIDHPG